MKVPLLITSSVIAYDVAVKLKDTNLRKIHALESIREWLRLDPSLQIILCDGSNYNFAKDVEHHFPSIDIECLYFENDQVKVEKYGRGYGEGEIVKYAINHSLHIRKIGAFAKCSSKLWVENYSECLKQWNGRILFSGLFENTYSLLKSPKLKNIDTRFYVISLVLYELLFQNAHITMRSREGHGLEDSFYDIFISEVRSECFLTISPLIRGVGGGSGLYYRESYFKSMKNRIQLILLRRNPKLKNIFIKSSLI